EHDTALHLVDHAHTALQHEQRQQRQHDDRHHGAFHGTPFLATARTRGRTPEGTERMRLRASWLRQKPTGSSAVAGGGTVEGVKAGHGLADVRQLRQSSHALLLIPIVLIVVITAVDQLVPADIHLGPLLVIAPAITASFAGPRLTTLIGVLTV